MVAHHPDMLGRNRDIEAGVAGLVTRIEERLLDRDVVDGQETIALTAHHVISGEPDDTLGALALVEIDAHHRGHRTPDPADRRTLLETSSGSTIGEGTSAVEDDTVPSLQR
jgi:hypothetical protein